MISPHEMPREQGLNKILYKELLETVTGCILFVLGQ